MTMLASYLGKITWIYVSLLCLTLQAFSGLSAHSYSYGEEMEDCPFSRKYRKIDGTCNNHLNPAAGSTFTPLRRLLPPDYADGIQAPRIAQDGAQLPNSRVISTTFKETGVEKIESRRFSHMSVLFGQFLSHDVANTVPAKDNSTKIECDCNSNRPECLKITVPGNDSFYGGKRTCIPMVRSAAYSGTSKPGKPRQQINSLTAHLDGTTVYESGDLKGMEGSKRSSLPLVEQISDDKKSVFSCPFHLHENRDTCFAAGEGRINENVGLTCIHAIFMREHNRIARKLKQINPHWTSNETFWETRKVISAITQHITYSEFLVELVGKKHVAAYDLTTYDKGYYFGYDATFDASITNVWATAAFRYGHTMVRNFMSELDPQYRPNSAPVEVHETLFNPSQLLNASDDKEPSIIRGLLEEPANNVNMDMSESLRSKMFTSKTKLGVDLMAINIERGREHGLPGYNQYREFCGLRKALNFDDLSREITTEKLKVLTKLYSHVDDIDIFVGGVLETALDKAAVGPTFACLNSEQFLALRKGDKKWYENPGSFSYEQLQEIRKVTLSSLLCANLPDMQKIQPNAMLLDSVPGNERIHCRNIPTMDLTKWKDILSSYEDSGVYTRWFHKTVDQTVQEVLQEQLTHHPNQICRGPLNYKKERFETSESKNERIKFMCPAGSTSLFPFSKWKMGYKWTQWFDRDTPSSNNGDDIESVERLLNERPQDMCPNPISIQVKSISAYMGLEPDDTVEYYSCTRGMIYRGDHQPSGKCSDYAVRFLCPEKFFEEELETFNSLVNQPNMEWTEWINVDGHSGQGDFETPALMRFLGKTVCRKPALIEGRLAENEISAAKTNDILKRFSALYGLQCRNEDQSNGRCHDYEVRYLCEKK